MKYLLPILLFFVGCVSTSPKFNPDLAEAKAMHRDIIILQGQEPLSENNWPSCSTSVAENAYQQPITFGAYFLYNFPLAMLKDFSILVAAPIAEATNVCLTQPTNTLNDSLDNGYEQNYHISYPDMQQNIWGQSNHTNYFNMDKYNWNNINYYNYK